MFYTLPAYEFAPEGADFSAMGAEPGTQVWRAVRLTIPKFFMVVEFKAGERKAFLQTVLCSEVDPVMELVAEADEHTLYLWVPAAASSGGRMELLPLVGIERGAYSRGMFRRSGVAHVFHVQGGGRFVDIYGLEESKINDKSFIYGGEQE